jgi:putative redox protein
MTNTINVRGKIEDNYRTEIECSHNFVLDQPPSAGGQGEGPNPLELLLSSLAGCFCAIGKIISNQNQLNIRGMNVKIEGDIDKSYLLGKTREGRAGFTEIRSYITVDADMTDREKADFVMEIERRCPIADSMSNNTKLITMAVQAEKVMVLDETLV